MAVNFPSNPGIGDTYGLSTNGRLWKYNGYGWEQVPTESDQSPQGIQGLQGSAGIATGQGVQGTQAADASQGIQGFGGQGIQGIQGAQGFQGLQGIHGLSDQGTQGLQSLQGNYPSPTGGTLTSGLTERVFFESETGIDTSFTIPTGKNAMSIGPHTIGVGATITVNEGSNWIVIEPDEQLIFTTTTNTSTFTLSSLGTTEYEVEWGDGNIEISTSNDLTHTYSTAGQYEISVEPTAGNTYRPYFLSAPSAASILRVGGVGGRFGSDLTNAWRSCINMESFSFRIDTSSATNFNSAWNNCSGLTSFPQLDVSSGTNFNSAWDNCSGLTSFPAIQFNTNAEVSFVSTWSDCTGLTSFPVIGCSSVTSFSQTWRDCTGLTSFPQLDVSNGTNFQFTWEGCNGLTSFPALDFISGTLFNNAWQGCTGLTTFPAVGFKTDVDNFFSSWYNCSNLVGFPTGMFDTCTTTNFNLAWKNCGLGITAIESILVSLDTAGQSNGTLDIDGGTNAPYSDWTTAAKTAYNNLVGVGWTVDFNT